LKLMKAIIIIIIICIKRFMNHQENHNEIHQEF